MTRFGGRASQDHTFVGDGAVKRVNGRLYFDKLVPGIEATGVRRRRKDSRQSPAMPNQEVTGFP